jgi:hypothetical protein
MTFNDHREGCWLAVYGATVALQVHDRMRDGMGSPDTDEEWDGITEEAEAVADLAAESRARRLKRER